VSYFPEIERWRIPENAMSASLFEMACDGKEGREGIALWLGKRDEGIVEVSHVFFLRGKGVVKQPDLLIVSRDLMNEVADKAIELRLALIGQIHSHGEGYSTNLSVTDRRYGVAVPFYLSVVAPDYALRPDTNITECGVHVFDRQRGYRRLSAAEISEQVEIFTGGVRTVVVGG
jgi:hypothetical protein